MLYMNLLGTGEDFANGQYNMPLLLLQRNLRIEFAVTPLRDKDSNVVDYVSWATYEGDLRPINSIKHDEHLTYKILHSDTYAIREYNRLLASDIIINRSTHNIKKFMLCVLYKAIKQDHRSLANHILRKRITLYEGRHICIEPADLLREYHMNYLGSDEYYTIFTTCILNNNTHIAKTILAMPNFLSVFRKTKYATQLHQDTSISPCMRSLLDKYGI